MNTIGFMQGRLSPLVDGKIQAFPQNHWQQEFRIAHANGYCIMEWTLDHDRLYKNPLMTEDGQKEINKLSKKYEISIPSLTGDCFMQAPFYKVIDNEKESLLRDLYNIINACSVLGVEFIVFPLVDNGSLDNTKQEESLMEGLSTIEPVLHKYSIKIVFESDFSPVELKDFIDHYPSEYYGINFDIGNSAALGFDPHEEMELYGHRILNVHIKDRVLHGTTVPLGRGNADIPEVLNLLESIGYNGNYILQTARAINGDHAGILCKYRDWITECLELCERSL